MMPVFLVIHTFCVENDPCVTCRYHMDPSGTFIEYEAKAIGSGSEGAQQALQEVYHKVKRFLTTENTLE